MIINILSIILSFLSIISDFVHILSWLAVAILVTLNLCILYVLTTDKKLKDYFVFEIENKWLKPNTLFIPFELNICLCNYFMLKACVFGYGLDLRIKWRDVVQKTITNTITNTMTSDKSQTPQLVSAEIPISDKIKII